MVGRPSRRYGIGWDTVPGVWKWSGGLVVVDRPSQRSASGQETPSEVQKHKGTIPEGQKRRGTIPEVQKRSGDPLGGPEADWGHFRRFGSDRGTLPEVRKRSRDPPERP